MGELPSLSHGADEAALARRAAAGDVRAFLTLHRRNQARVYDLCHRILGSPQEAADATRETFVGVLRGTPSLLAAAREACHRRLDLPGVAAHEREVLALCELEDLSYEEVAEIMGIDWDSVAQLHDWALAPEPDDSEECERALPLIALERDGGLDGDSNEAGWLTEHLMHCRSCRGARDAMREAHAAVAAPPAAEQVAPPRHRLRHVTVIAALASLLMVALLVAVSHEGPLGLIVPAAEEEPAAAATERPSPQAAERPDEPAGTPAGTKTARKKGRAERRGRERRKADRRNRGRREVRPAKRERRPEPSERVRRERSGGVAAPPAEQRKPSEAEPEGRRPRRQVQLERRPDRGGQDELVPAPSPVPPPTETAPVQPTPVPPSR